RPDPDQRLVLAGTRPRRDERGRSRDRDLVADADADVRPADDPLVVFCNRVGVDESISFWGGSEVIAPSGHALFSAPFFEEGLFTVDVPLADLRRERLALPLLRDERPELEVRELTRIVAERAGLAPDTTADELAQAGLDVAPGEPLRDPIGFREDPKTPAKIRR